MIVNEAADIAREVIESHGIPGCDFEGDIVRGLAAVDFLEREAARAERAHALEAVLPDLRNLLVWAELRFSLDGNTNNDAIMDRLNDVFGYRSAPIAVTR